MKGNILNFIQSNSPDGGFLQSEQWSKFQEGWGRKTHNIFLGDDGGEFLAYANIISHTLPLVGNYFYVPRGPVVSEQRTVNNEQYFNKKFIIFRDKLLNIAKENNAGWVRVEPNSREGLKLIQENLPNGIKMKKSSVDMQSKEILVMDISGSEEDMLARMKPKTRYNIRLAEKKGVKIYNSREERYIDGFCRLVKITAERDKIKSHPEEYYRKMFEAIPDDTLRLYIAEYEGKIIVANLVLFFGSTATYMHGASASVYRNVMAPYLLQWQQIKDAKKAGCMRYDFGGVKTGNAGGKSWEGITKFKTGFAPEVETIQFPGCYDIVLNSNKHNLYRILQKVKRIF
ncbi:MAG: peptidoglycan bridge formation glycyltransferase FemA/FemB family protein [Candidatus Moranbacteria bacterium]|nr:peptidoglycan bridge formation glycyltransferase FemA/FemB family protein [Candidatus Moranbacteria bacterium]